MHWSMHVPFTHIYIPPPRKKSCMKPWWDLSIMGDGLHNNMLTTLGLLLQKVSWTKQMPGLQTQIGCFNHRMVTLVADKLKKQWSFAEIKWWRSLGRVHDICDSCQWQRISLPGSDIRDWQLPQISLATRYSDVRDWQLPQISVATR